MARSRFRSVAVGMLGGAVLMAPLVGAGPSAAASGFPYTIHGVEQETFTDEGFCAPGAAQITIDAKFVVHVNATEPDLTDAEILAALESEDDTGLFNSLTFTETGTFTDVESNGVTYTGRFTMWFGGSFNERNETGAFTSTFSARGSGSDGTRLNAHGTGHVTFVRGETVVEFDRFTVRGCAGS